MLLQDAQHGCYWTLSPFSIVIVMDFFDILMLPILSAQISADLAIDCDEVLRLSWKVGAPNHELDDVEK